MTTLVKFIVTTLLSLSLFSCNFDMNFINGVHGNGHVITKQRQIKDTFTAIKATEGLNIILTQNNKESVVVEADENLQDIIVTEVIDNVLIIHTTKNIAKSKSKKIFVNFSDISSIKSTSGSDVIGTNTFNLNRLELETTSGSNMKIKINSNTILCKSTSGSSLVLSGKTNSLNAEATSGSSIKAAELITESCNVKATSGANISINTLKELTAKATSGANITYYGNPEFVNKSDNSAGSIRKR